VRRKRSNQKRKDASWGAHQEALKPPAAKLVYDARSKRWVEVKP
jgi:hypothetical protein